MKISKGYTEDTRVKEVIGRKQAACTRARRVVYNWVLIGLNESVATWMIRCWNRVCDRVLASHHQLALPEGRKMGG